MALEIDSNEARVDDGVGGKLALCDVGPSGVLAMSMTERRGGRVSEVSEVRLYNITASEGLRLAAFLVETQTREHVPLHPDHRKALEAAIAVLRSASAPHWLEFLDNANHALVAARDELAAKRKRGERTH